MKKFVLHGEMADLFASEIELDVSSPYEAINALCTNFKGFRRYIIKKSLSGVSYSFIDSKNNKYDGHCGHIILKSDHYDIVASPQGHGGMMAMMGSFFGNNPIGAGIANAALGFGMQKLVNKFTKNVIQEDDVPEYEIIETNSFIYSQNENKTQQGSPVPVIYGQLRVGTKVINSSVENYDYDNEDAYIYENPPNLESIELIHGGQFSFVVAPTGEDFRSTTDTDAFQSFSQEGKRTLSFGENGAKNFDENIGNEGNHESMDSGGNEYGAMHKASFGPSTNKPLVRSGGRSSFKENSVARPYVFPPATQIDYWMRPQSSSNFCVERYESSGQVVNQSLAWIGPNENSDQMIVGNRGSFQKLESIGIYKSLEVLSEGPIGGLAMPISADSDRDNGKITYPLEVPDTSISKKDIQLGHLKYHDYNPAGNLSVADLASSSTAITIKSSGSNYKDSGGTLLHGPYSISGNDLTSHSHKLTLSVEAPNVSYAAKITDSPFDDSESFNIGGKDYYLSENKIFLINPDDGEVILNSNTTSNPAKLNSKYYSSSSFDLEELSNDPPNRHPDDSEPIDFFVGENYANGTVEYSIVPPNKKARFNIELQPAEHTEDIYSKAQCLDLGALLGYDIIGQTVSASYQDYESYNSSTTVPGAVDRDGNNYNWSDMARIYLAGNSDLPSTPEDTEIDIPVGYLARKDGLPFNPNNLSSQGGNTNFTNLEAYGNQTVYYNGVTSTPDNTNTSTDTYQAQLYIKLNLADYIGLKEIPEEWNDWENWYLNFGGNKFPARDYKQMHTFSPSPANYPSWNQYQDYTSSDLVSYAGKVYQPKQNIIGNPETTSYPTFNLEYSYPANSRVKYQNKAYENPAFIIGNPAQSMIDEWSRYNRYSPLPSSAINSSPPAVGLSAYTNLNTAKQGTEGYFYRKTTATEPQPNDFGVAMNLTSWNSGQSYSRGDIFIDSTTSSSNFQSLFFAKRNITAHASNLSPEVSSDWEEYEYNPPSTDAHWESITLNTLYPQDDSRWTEIPNEDNSPPTSNIEWDAFSFFASGTCVTVGDQFYCADDDIDAVDDPSSFLNWDPLGTYGDDVENFGGKVSYKNSVYEFIGSSTIQPESDSDYLTDAEVQTLYSSTNNPDLAPQVENGVTLWPSVPKSNAPTLSEKYLTSPDSDSTNWQLVTKNKHPTEGGSGWTVNSKWKLKQTNFPENFSREDYYAFCDYESREGVIQNPDPSPADPGFFAGLFGKVKYTRQSNRQADKDRITQGSRFWQRLMDGNGLDLQVGHFLRENFQKAKSSGNTSAYYEQKIKKWSGSKINHLSAEGVTLLYSQGPDFNDKIISLFGSNIPTPSLSSKGARSGNSRQGTISGEGSASLNLNQYKSNQTRHIRFIVGSGGNHLNNEQYADSFPKYMTQGNKESFSSVKMFREGYNDRDDSSKPYGFYDPQYYPRVTVFVIRKRASGQLDFCPTTIEAVAKVDGSDGVIDRVYLLNSPTNPVYDSILLSENSNGFTPISPQDIESVGYSYQSEDFEYQDIGVYLKVDATHGYHNVNFNTSSGGLVGSSSPTDGLFGLNSSWKDHILEDAVGLLREMPIMPNGQIIRIRNLGNTSGKVQVSTESSLNTSSAIDSGLPSTINTGRVKSFTISTSGSGYTNRFQGYIYNQKFIAKKITSYGEERGYKPNSSFIIYGLPKSIFDSNPSNIQNYVKFKARVYTNEYGRIQASATQGYSVRIIDSGTSFSGENDELIFLDKDYHSELTTAEQARLQAIRSTVHSSNPDILQTNESHFLLPEVHLPKQTAILEATMSNGTVSTFKLKTNGLGFNPAENILDPFQLIEFKAPTVNFTFSNGTLVSATLDTTAGSLGYSPSDTRIKLRVSKPFVPAGTFPQDDPDNDPYDKFRSIFLNDVPIRDHTDRFNYSKFHFDMRIGNFKNNSNTHNIKGTLAPIASHQLISNEFRIPTHSKFVNYPLYGPRNEHEKDYYYTHTIKNPSITDVSFSIKINQLHYIYEGDESAVYLNLLPIIGMVLGYMLGKWLIEKAISAIFPEFSITYGMGVSSGFSIPSFKQAFELAAAVAAFAVIQAGGIFLAILAFNWISKVFKCHQIPWLCIKLGSKIKNSGEIWPSKMRIAIEHGIEGEELATDTIIFRGCATSSYVKDIFINNLPSAQKIGTNTEIKKNRIFRIYRLTRELDPVTGGLTEARYKIDAELLAVNEYVGGYFSYPNTALVGTRLNSRDHPSLPRREYLIKGRLIRVPSNYNPINGSYDGAWNGQFDSQLQWTSNPAWIVYDLLTNDRYGMGKYGIKDEDIDKWSFYKFAKRCDEKVDVIVEGVQTQERRHMCNLYIDSERQAYDYIKDLMQIYNTKINFTAGTIHIVQDAPAEGGPVMLFNNSNVSEDGFSYSSTPETDRITAATVDFVDERDNYMRKTEYVEDAEGVREHGYSHTKIAGLGITRRGEAHRLAWHKILTKQLEKELILFSTGIRGSYLRIGDVIEVMDNNKVSHHSGGRISSIISNNVIEIDIPVSALGNASKIYIESPVQDYSQWKAGQSFVATTVVMHESLFYKSLSGTNTSTPPNEDTTNWESVETVRQTQFEEYTISSKNGFNITISESLSSDIKSGFTWIIKENPQNHSKPRQYRIKQVSEVSALQYEIAATEHLEDKYNQVDNSAGAQKGIEFESREYYGPPISTA